MHWIDDSIYELEKTLRGIEYGNLTRDDCEASLSECISNLKLAKSELEDEEEDE